MAGGATTSMDNLPPLDTPIIGASKLSPTTSANAIEWGYILGGFAGSWIGGSAVGYMVQRRKQAAITGGFAANGLWSLAESYRSATAAKWFTAMFFALSGAGSLYLAYRRGTR